MSSGAGRSAPGYVWRSSDDARQDERGGNRVGAARLAPALRLIRLHLGRVVASLVEADRRRHAVADHRCQELVRVAAALALDKLIELSPPTLDSQFLAHGNSSVPLPAPELFRRRLTGRRSSE